MKITVFIILLLLAFGFRARMQQTPEERRGPNYFRSITAGARVAAESLREETSEGMKRVGALPSPRGDTAEYNQAQQGVWVTQADNKSWKASDKGAPFRVIALTNAALTVGATGALLHWKTTEGTLTLWWDPNFGQHFRFDGDTRTPIDSEEEMRLWKKTVEMAVSPLPGASTVDVTVSIP